MSGSNTINFRYAGRWLWIVALLALLLPAVGTQAQTTQTVLNETFDDATGFGPSNLFFSDSNADYFGLSDGAGGGDFGGDAAPSLMSSHSGLNGNFLVGEDLDGEGATLPFTVTWSGLEITGLESLEFSGLFAEDDSDGGKIDGDDYIRLAYRIDTGEYEELLWFSGGNFGSTSNSTGGYFMLDEDFDGVGEGTMLGSVAQSFTAAIVGTGSTLDLQLTLSVNQGSDDFALDDFTITGEPATPSAGDIIVTEIMQNPAAVGDSDGEYFELYNTTTSPIDIDGWSFVDDGTDSHTINNGGPLEVPAQGYLVLARSASSPVDPDYVYSGYALANGGDEVVLLDPQSTEIDRVNYDGGANFPNPTGASIELCDLTADNNVGSNWAESTGSFIGNGDFGTPGFGNSCDPTVDNPPIVVSTSPEANATDVNPNASIDFVFSEAVTVDSTPASIDCGTGALSYTLTGSGTSWSIVPDAPLPLNSTCGFVLDVTEVTDIDGATNDPLLDTDGDPNGFFGFGFTVGDGVTLVTAPYAPDLETTCLPEDWFVVSVDADTIWSCNNSDGDITISANAFGASAPADDWLITAPVDFSGLTDPTLTFETWTRFADGGLVYPQLELLYSTDYTGTGDPTAATWNQLNYTASPEDSQAWTSSGDISLNGVPTTTAYFAFRYRSSGTGAGSTSWWLIDNFSVDEPPPPPPITLISAIQGTGNAVAITDTVQVDAVVVADLQETDELDGFFIQEEDADADGDPLTSEGIFVSCGDNNANCPDVALGDVVQVTASASENFGMSRLVPASSSDVTVTGTAALPTPASISFPIPAASGGVDYLERFEGMSINITSPMTVTEYFQYGRFGQVRLWTDGTVTPSNSVRPYQFTAKNAPDTTGFSDYQAELARQTITLDDSRTFQNPTTLPYPYPGFGVSNSFRGGDVVTGLDGVLNYSFGQWGIQNFDPSTGAEVDGDASLTFNELNARPTTTPTLPMGNLRVASFNVLNYFNGDGQGGGFPTSRGATTASDFQRQRDKIIEAICLLDADIVGLNEIENDYADGANSAAADLVAGLNASSTCGSRTYAYVDPGTNVGSDEIAVGFIYDTNSVNLLNSPTNPAILEDSAPFISEPIFNGEDTNRVPMAATFVDNNGGELTLIVNHFKSKGGSGTGANVDQGDGQGNWNDRRTKAAQAILTWIGNAPTGSTDDDYMIIGDLNAYDEEDPVTTLESNGFTDLVNVYQGDDAYGYVFDGRWGYLDYAMANSSLNGQILGAADWHINADEPSILSYSTEFGTPAAWYEPNQYRSSDHDPVIVSLNLTAPPPPTIEERADVNNDGIISPADAVYVINRLGDTPAPSEADVVIDGTIDNNDVSAVISRIGTTP